MHLLSPNSPLTPLPPMSHYHLKDSTQCSVRVKLQQFIFKLGSMGLNDSTQDQRLKEICRKILDRACSWNCRRVHKFAGYALVRFPNPTKPARLVTLSQRPLLFPPSYPIIHRNPPLPNPSLLFNLSWHSGWSYNKPDQASKEYFGNCLVEGEFSSLSLPCLDLSKLSSSLIAPFTWNPLPLPVSAPVGGRKTIIPKNQIFNLVTGMQTTRYNKSKLSQATLNRL